MSTVNVALVEPSFPRASSSAEGDLIEQLRDKCGFVLQGIDWVIEKVTGWSLLEAIFDPLLGDYSAVDKMSKDWHTLGLNFGYIGENYGSLSGALPEVWNGGGGSGKAKQKFADFASGCQTQAEASELVSQALQDMLLATKTAAEGLAEIMSLVDELVLKLISGPLGVVGEIATGGRTVRRIITLCDRAITIINKLRNIVPPLLQGLAVMSSLVKGLRIAFQMTAAATTATTGGKADEVADAGF